MKSYKVRAMADIVINHRVGTTKGHGGMYNRYDGIPLAWDERAVTACTGGKVMILQHWIYKSIILNYGVLCMCYLNFATASYHFLVTHSIIREMLVCGAY